MTSKDAVPAASTRKPAVGKMGTLIIIGGGEDKMGERGILREVAKGTQGGRMTIATIATQEPDEALQVYRRIFSDLGVKEITGLDVRDRAAALSGKAIDGLHKSRCVFFTGGDQLQITSLIGDTPIEHEIGRIYQSGGMVAGTSAGASVMGSIMLSAASRDDTHRIGDIHMSPGLGLLKNVIIDQHFAERGRIGRLLAAVAQNPRMLGIGIDENTAILVKDGTFRVIGSGAIYVIDGSTVTHSNMSDERPDRILSLHNVSLHVLSTQESFDLTNRKPIDRLLGRGNRKAR